MDLKESATRYREERTSESVGWETDAEQRRRRRKGEGYKPDMCSLQTTLASKDKGAQKNRQRGLWNPIC